MHVSVLICTVDYCDIDNETRGLHNHITIFAISRKLKRCHNPKTSSYSNHLHTIEYPVQTFKEHLKTAIGANWQEVKKDMGDVFSNCTFRNRRACTLGDEKEHENLKT